MESDRTGGGTVQRCDVLDSARLIVALPELAIAPSPADRLPAPVLLLALVSHAPD